MDSSFIDLYCERTEFGLWNEPINAFSNVAILLAAVYSWKIAHQHHKTHNKLIKSLISLCAIIALGSFLFHTFATSWAQLADILPIWTFMALFVFALVFQMSKQNLLLTLGLSVTGLAILLAGSMTLLGEIDSLNEQDQFIFNGSEHYAPALIVLLGFAVFTHWIKYPIYSYLYTALTLFTIALFFRTIDLQTCVTTQGLGTHFLWHVINALVLVTLLKGLIISLPDKPTPTSS